MNIRRGMMQKFLEAKRKNPLIIALICIVLALLLAIAVYYFLFTRSGQVKIGDPFRADLHLVANGKELYWYDVHHSNDPNDPMFGNIESALIEFNPDLLLVEGGFDTFEGNRDTAIYEGESSFATYIAKQNGIPVEDIEPPFDKQIEYLQSKYPAGEILAMYLIRQISSLQFMPDNSMEDFDGLLLRQTQYLKENGLNHPAETQEEIQSLINSFLSEPLSTDNWLDIDIRPIRHVYQRKGGVLYPVYMDTVSFRNIWLVDLIKDKKDHYNKIFVIMGGDHIRATKDQLEAIYLD